METTALPRTLKLIFSSELQMMDPTNSANDPGGTTALLLDTTVATESYLSNQSYSSSLATPATVNYSDHQQSQDVYGYWNLSSTNMFLPDQDTYMTLNGSNDNSSLTYATTEMQFIDVMGIWVTGLFCLLGIAGNVLSFIVLVRAFGRSPMFFVLRAVAVSDAVFLATVFVMQTLVNMYPFTGALRLCNEYRGYIQVIVWPLLMMTQMSTVWLTILVSVERYIAICFPLKSVYLLSLTRIKRAVAGVFVASILFNIPHYFEYQVDDNDYRYIDKTEMGDNPYYRYIYICTLYFFVLFLVPLALLITLNLKLVLALQQGKKQWQKLHSRQKREQTLTIIPLTIVLVFFICATPALTVNIIESMNPNINHNTNFLRFLVVGNLLVVLNSACNFIIYCMLGKRFRTKLLDLCRCHGNNRKKHNYQVVQQLVTSQITDV